MTSQSQPITPVRVPKAATAYTPTTQDPDLRSQINAELLREGHVEKYISLPLQSQTSPSTSHPKSKHSHISASPSTDHLPLSQNRANPAPSPPRPPLQLAPKSLPARPLPPPLRRMHHLPETHGARPLRHKARHRSRPPQSPQSRFLQSNSFEPVWLVRESGKHSDLDGFGLESGSAKEGGGREGEWCRGCERAGEGKGRSSGSRGSEWRCEWCWQDRRGEYRAGGAADGD
jgi:hypothetical protein